MIIKIIGQRLTLRPPRMSDAQDIYEGVQHRSVPRYTFVPSPYSLDDAHAFIKHSQKTRKAGTDLVLAIIENDSGKLIGMIGLHKICKKYKRGEVGYWLNIRYRGNGYVTEALDLVVEFCFKTLKFGKIESSTMVGNDISRHLLLKAGFKEEGLLRRHMKHRGRWIDLYRYGLLKSEHT